MKKMVSDTTRRARSILASIYDERERNSNLTRKKQQTGDELLIYCFFIYAESWNQARILTSLRKIKNKVNMQRL